MHLEIESAEGASTLIIEAMGRHANVILCAEDGVVMDAIKRVGPHLSRVRPILPGDLYAPPPPQDKFDPTDVTERRLHEVLGDVGPERSVWRALVSGVRGVSPLLAKEVVYRAMGTIETRVCDIDLDPQLTAVENTQAYFRRYEKVKAATADLPDLISRTDLELDYLDQLSTDLALASNWPDIDEVKSALVEAGYTQRKHGPKMWSRKRDT